MMVTKCLVVMVEPCQIAAKMPNNDDRKNKEGTLVVLLTPY